MSEHVATIDAPHNQPALFEMPVSGEQQAYNAAFSDAAARYNIDNMQVIANLQPDAQLDVFVNAAEEAAHEAVAAYQAEQAMQAAARQKAQAPQDINAFRLSMNETAAAGKNLADFQWGDTVIPADELDSRPLQTEADEAARIANLRVNKITNLQTFTTNVTAAHQETALDLPVSGRRPGHMRQPLSMDDMSATHYVDAQGGRLPYILPAEYQPAHAAESVAESARTGEVVDAAPTESAAQLAPVIPLRPRTRPSPRPDPRPLVRAAAMTTSGGTGTVTREQIDPSRHRVTPPLETPMYVDHINVPRVDYSPDHDDGPTVAVPTVAHPAPASGETVPSDVEPFGSTDISGSSLAGVPLGTSERIEGSSFFDDGNDYAHTEQDTEPLPLPIPAAPLSRRDKVRNALGKLNLRKQWQNRRRDPEDKGLELEEGDYLPGFDPRDDPNFVKVGNNYVDRSTVELPRGGLSKRAYRRLMEETANDEDKQAAVRNRLIETDDENNVTYVNPAGAALPLSREERDSQARQVLIADMMSDGTRQAVYRGVAHENPRRYIGAPGHERYETDTEYAARLRPLAQQRFNEEVFRRSVEQDVARYRMRAARPAGRGALAGWIVANGYERQYLDDPRRREAART